MSLGVGSDFQWAQDFLIFTLEQRRFGFAFRIVNKTTINS